MKKIIVLLISVVILCGGILAFPGEKVSANDPIIEEERWIYKPEYAQIPLLETEETPNNTLKDNLTIEPLFTWDKMVTQSFRDMNWEIYLENNRLTNQKQSDTSPRLTRGCTDILYVNVSNNKGHIVKMKSDGSGKTDLTGSADCYAPQWSWDGKKIVYQAYVSGNSDIWIMNANGTNKQQLTSHSAYDAQPAISPDGQKIAFISYRTGGYRVWVMDVDGSNPIQLNNQMYSAHPTWSPDGSRIAYDADQDNDYMQELWVMNSDGSGQFGSNISKPNNNTEMAYGWDPVGVWVTYTQVQLIYYKGNWYWQSAKLREWGAGSLDNAIDISSTKLDWNPDIASCDVIPPISILWIDSPISVGPIDVRLRGKDNPGGSGAAYMQIQVKESEKAEWTMWHDDLTAYEEPYWGIVFYPGIGGHTVYFRARTRDYAYNWEPWPSVPNVITTVEWWPPNSWVNPLPRYSRNPLTISWEGEDPGGSGITSFDLQMMDSGIGNWVNWFTNIITGTQTYVGEMGHTYAFRSRAIDEAYNQEDYPPFFPDTITTIFGWSISGFISDNRDVTIQEGITSIAPDEIVSDPSNADGSYAAYSGSNPEHWVNWSKQGYASLPDTLYKGGNDARLNIVLPPTDNLIENWGFEDNPTNPDGWETGGTLPPVVTPISDSLQHTGAHALKLGRELTFTPPSLFWEGDDSTLSNHTVLTDQNGKSFMFWHASEKGLYLATRPKGGDWTAPALINPISSLGLLRAAVQSDGTLHVAWIAGSVIYYIQKPPSGVWTAPIIAVLYDVSEQFNLILGEDGIVHLLYRADPFANYLGYVKRSLDGNWTTPETIGLGGDLNAWQSILDNQGNIHILFQTHNNDGPTYYIQMRNNGNWSDIEALAGHAANPVMGMDNNQVLHLLYEEARQPEGRYYLTYLQRMPSGEWSNPELVPGVIHSDRGSYSKAFMVTPGGSVLYAFLTLNIDNFKTEIYYIHCDPSGNWSPAEQLEGEYLDFKYFNIGEDNNIYLIWTEYDSNTNHTHIKYAVLTPMGELFTVIQAVEDATFTFPYFIIEPDNILIYWVNQDFIDQDIYTVQYATAPAPEQYWVSQTVSIPDGMLNPTLSFFTNIQNMIDPAETWFDIRAEAGISDTIIYRSANDEPGWQNHWVDLSDWVSQTVTLTLTTHQSAGSPYMSVLLDEVTLGSAYPDVWIDFYQSTTQALPGDQVVYHLVYGNRGSVIASNVRITNTLPVSLTFVSASLTPTLVSPYLVWEVGDLPSGSGPFSITITATLSTDAPILTNLLNTAVINVPSGETELENNFARFELFVGVKVYIPICSKQ